jgi:hypothetical protein
MRTFITADPFTTTTQAVPRGQRGYWPGHWVACAEAGAPPFVTAYRRRFDLPEAATIRIHVTADERYELFLDGRRLGRGPERGDRDHWFYETYDLPLAAGAHLLAARVWTLGDWPPHAQMSVYPGFLLAAEPPFLDLLGTGVAPWEARPLPGYSFHSPMPAWGTGMNMALDGRAYPWGWEQDAAAGGEWRPVAKRDPGINYRDFMDCPPVHMLAPATLPPMLERERGAGIARFVGADLAANAPIRPADDLPAERAAWTRLLAGGEPITIPPLTRRRVILDLEDYCCAYPELVTSGGAGASIHVNWAEALFCEPEHQTKGNRDEVAGKYFLGVGDTFLPDGGADRVFQTLWWQAGRYLEVRIETAAAPLAIRRLSLRETRYPLEMESAFRCGDDRLNRVQPLMLRALQMCAHETYMDCPYYEQLMYVGDTRLEILATYAITSDDRLPRKAIRMFDASRLPTGLTQSRYPCRVRQVIPPFALWWIGMVHDAAFWRDDAPFIREMLPGVRGVLDAFLAERTPQGLVAAPTGWNFMDWTLEWDGGVPPDGTRGVSGVLNWQMVLALKMAAELEAAFGEPELAARARRLARELAAQTAAAFWDEGRQLFADDLEHRHFSEHAQCLAILGGELPPSQAEKAGAALLRDPALTRTTIYFMHYLFEAYRLLGQPDAMLARLQLWFDLERLGFKTTSERPEPSRSDCHAWGAHPLFHCFATILGIRPASPGFRTVAITPRLGALPSAAGTLVHPRGRIEMAVRREGAALHGHVTLPAGVTGTLRLGDGQVRALQGGRREEF